VILYDHAASGNCMKCRLALRELEIAYESVSVDLFRGETRTDEHFARNPDGRVPVLELDSGEAISESGAILLYLGEGTPLMPADPLTRARVHQWMFFEQNRIEADLSVARFLKLSGRWRRMPEVFSKRLERGRDALETLERGLADGRGFVAGEDFTVADLALYGYVHCGADADPSADPRLHERISGWLDRVEARPGFVNDLVPLPAYASERPV
jgi:glutathione S-transferase